MENLERILAIITSVIGSITAIYKIGFKTNHKRTEEYYQKILIPFVTKYKKDNNINTIRFLDKKLKVKNENVPKYIFYLMDEQRETDLKKVLIYDYLDIYHNDNATMNQILRSINKALSYVMFFLSFIFLYFGIMSIMIVFYSIITDAFYDIKGINSIQLSNSEWNIWQIIIGAIFIVCSFLLIIFVKFWNEDMYTVKKDKIEKIISKKVRIYDKRKDNYVV